MSENKIVKSEDVIKDLEIFRGQILYSLSQMDIKLKNINELLEYLAHVEEVTLGVEPPVSNDMNQITGARNDSS